MSSYFRSKQKTKYNMKESQTSFPLNQNKEKHPQMYVPESAFIMVFPMLPLEYHGSLFHQRSRPGFYLCPLGLLSAS